MCGVRAAGRGGEGCVCFAVWMWTCMDLSSLHAADLRFIRLIPPISQPPQTNKQHNTGLRLASTGSDKTAAIQRAASHWVEGARGTFIRFVLAQDEPDRLTQVPVAASEEGADEEYVSVAVAQEEGSRGEAAVAPAVVAGGKVVVGGVVAKAPTLRRKLPAAEKGEEEGQGADGKKAKS